MDALQQACRTIAEALGVALQHAADPGEGPLGARLEAIAEAAGLRVRRVYLRPGWWRCGAVPLIALGSAAQPLALIPDGSGRYWRGMPGRAGSQRVDEMAAAAVEAWAYSIYPPQPFSRRGWAAGLLTGQLGAALLLGTLSALLGLAGPLLVLALEAGGRGMSHISMIGLGLAVALAAAGLGLWRSIVLARLESRGATTAQAGLWGRLLALPAAFFRSRTPGALAAALDGVGALRLALGAALTALTLYGPLALAALGLLLALSWRAGLAALGMAVAVGSIWLLLVRRSQPVAAALANSNAVLAGRTLALIGGVGKLRGAAAEARALAVWEGEAGRSNALALSAAHRRGTVTALLAALPPLFQLLTLAGGGLGWWSSPGELLAALGAAGLLGSALSASGGALAGAARALPQAAQLRPMLESAPELPPGGRDPGPLSGPIELRNISFRYADGPPTLEDVSIALRPGAFVALTGPSGSGKSTLVRLLLGFERPERGAVLFNGEDLAGLDLRRVRRQIGAVLQHARLTPGDILSNIIGATPLTEEDAWRAAELAGIAADIQALPMQMRTVVAEGRSALSGGQRQRLLIARALAQRPQLLLIDEGTSALDERTQALVMAQIARLQLTRLVIAHRISTVRTADWIYVLDRGRVVQQGRYDDLYAAPGLFRELARRQMQDG